MSSRADSSSSRKRILVVDDSPTGLRVTSHALQEKGYHVRCASDGAEAIEVADAFRPDLIVLDIILPKMNGFQVVRQLRSTSHTSETSILLLSSKSAEEDRFWGLKQGADGYLTKPFDMAELLRLVSELLAGNAIPTEIAPSCDALTAYDSIQRRTK